MLQCLIEAQTVTAQLDNLEGVLTAFQPSICPSPVTMIYFVLNNINSYLNVVFQCNGYDFTMVTHKKAVDYIKKHPILNLLVARKGVTST